VVWVDRASRIDFAVMRLFRFAAVARRFAAVGDSTTYFVQPAAA
jgi:hypothetical protein